MDPQHRDGTYLQFIADATAAGIAHCSADRRFLFVNKAYAARFGLTPDDLVGRPVVEILGEEAYEAIKPYVERVLAGEAFHYEISVNYKLAGWHYLHCAYSPEIDGQGRVAGWVAVITDISDRYRLLDVARITQGRIELRQERVELAAIVERAVETSRPVLEAARHRLTVDYFFDKSPEGSPCVEADLTRMAQVVSIS